jgi:nicotinate-nucleotide--dimethylbenzimidazole phosphoribosyltransferase
VKDYLLFSHSSAEPANRAMLRWVGVSPVPGLEMRLGESSAFALLIAIPDAALTLCNPIATFAEGQP